MTCTPPTTQKLFFLDLPGEIRNEIYHHTFSSAFLAHNTHAQLQPCHSNDPTSQRRSTSSSSSHIFALPSPSADNPTAPPSPYALPTWLKNFFALRAVNRQLHDEIDSLLSPVVLRNTVFRSSADKAEESLRGYCPQVLRCGIQTLELREFLFAAHEGWTEKVLEAFSSRTARKYHLVAPATAINPRQYPAHTTETQAKTQQLLGAAIRAFDPNATDLCSILPSLKHISLFLGHYTMPLSLPLAAELTDDDEDTAAIVPQTETIRTSPTDAAHRKRAAIFTGIKQFLHNIATSDTRVEKVSLLFQNVTIGGRAVRLSDLETEAVGTEGGETEKETNESPFEVEVVNFR